MRAKKRCRQEESRRSEQRAALEKEHGALQTELANLKGLFTGKRRTELEVRLAEIEMMLKGL